MGNTANDGMRSPEWYRPRIAYLSQFILPERFETFRQVLSMRTRWMTVCMENTFHPQNASAIIRNCEAFGIQDIHTVETLCPFSPNTHIVKGTDKWIDLHRHADTAGALAALRRAGYRLIATTPHSGDTSPEAFDVSQSPFVLIFGTEHAGISDEVKAAADGFIRIPMCGFVESLNVSASAAILLSQLSSRLRAGNAPWRLSDDEQAALPLAHGEHPRLAAHPRPRISGVSGRTGDGTASGQCPDLLFSGTARSRTGVTGFRNVPADRTATARKHPAAPSHRSASPKISAPNDTTADGFS